MLSACSVFKISEREIIKGRYEVINREKTNIKESKILCNIYDKKDNAPISNAAIQLNELKIGGFTNNEGNFEFEVPPGNYTITVINAGNTTLTTKIMKFEPFNKTVIKFELGTTIIY